MGWGFRGCRFSEVVPKNIFLGLITVAFLLTLWVMFIVRTRTNTARDGSPYVTHRLVESRREGDKVRQKTLLNLGRTFSIAKEDWRLVCQRVDELMTHQTTLNFMTLPAEIET